MDVDANMPEHVAADSDLKQRFEREARTVAALNHPHICTLHDIGSQDGIDFLVMEYLDGETLAQRLEKGALPLDQTLQIAIQIADALDKAHRQGIVHRDLKPGNIMLTTAGAKVLDFGIATRLIDSELETVTRSQASLANDEGIAGTVPYMAPELLRGDPATAASDVWALGASLQEMITGERPFAGATGADVTSAILRDSPRRIPEGSPGGLRTVLHRCLAKEPERRFQTAAEIRAALEATTALPEAAAPGAPDGWWASHRAAWIGTATAVILAALAGWFFLGARDRVAPEIGLEGIDSLAVLPLANTSADPDQEYLSDGMTEALITELAKLGSVKVIGRTSVMQYKGALTPLPQIARELGVDAIVAGSVATAGDDVRVTAQLIKGSSDAVLWAETYQRDFRDVLTLQSQIARSIGVEIQAVLTPDTQARLENAGPVDPDAYQLTLQGQFYANQLSQDALERGIRYFEEAIAQDPSYAPAHAGLAFAYSNLSSVYLPPLEVMPLAKAAAAKAIELAPDLAAPHAWMGNALLFFDWDWAGAERELQLALELNPSSAEAHLIYGSYLLGVGQTGAALAEIRRAEELDPQSIIVYSSLWGSQWVSFLAGQYEIVLADGAKALEIAPTYAWAHAYIGMALAQQGQISEGLSELREATRLDGSPLLKAFLAHTYAVVGSTVEARELLGEVEQISRQRYLCAYEIAVTYVALGEPDTAFQWLNKAVDDRADCIAYLHFDPRFESLRDDPRFAEMLERVGAPTAPRTTDQAADVPNPAGAHELTVQDGRRRHRTLDGVMAAASQTEGIGLNNVDALTTLTIHEINETADGQVYLSKRRAGEHDGTRLRRRMLS